MMSDFASNLRDFAIQNMRNTTTTYGDGICDRCNEQAVVSNSCAIEVRLCAACWLEKYGNPLVAGESLPPSEHRTAEQVKIDNDEMDQNQNYPHERVSW